MYDVVILGGGPAGCLAAAGVKKSNPALSVCLIEKETDNKHRVGEAFLTGFIYTLYDAGLINVINNGNWLRKCGATYVWGESTIPWVVGYSQDDFSPDYPAEMQDKRSRYTVHAPRHLFDKELLEETKRVYDITIVNELIDDVLVTGKKNKRVTEILLKNGERIQGKYYIDATGQASLLGRKVTERTPVISNRQSAYAYYKNVDWELAQINGFSQHTTNIISNDNGWMWIIHLGERGNHLTSVGIVSNKEITDTMTPETIHSMFPELTYFGLNKGAPTYDFKGTQEVSSFYSHPDYSFKCEELHGQNWALCGDSALFIDPILSQGVTLASHYGWMRGLGAAEFLSGKDDSQGHVTQHYLKETAILAEMVGYWYSSNKQAKNWRLKASEFVPSDADVDDHFIWISNLENIRSEYKVYNDRDQVVINAALGFDPNYMIG
jgi:halogenation protein CepH